jgi:hypothetical protein
MSIVSGFAAIIEGWHGFTLKAQDCATQGFCSLGKPVVCSEFNRLPSLSVMIIISGNQIRSRQIARCQNGNTLEKEARTVAYECAN